MLSFAGFLGRSGEVGPHVHQFLSAHADERLVHAAYVRTDGRVGSFCVPPTRVLDLLPPSQCVMLSREQMTEGVWDMPPAFAALELAAEQSDRAHYALEAPLLARIASVFLQRGLDIEAALSRTLDKFPAAMSTIFLLTQNGVPTLVATRRGPPIWLRQSQDAFAIFGGAEPPITAADVRPIQLGDTVVVDRRRLSVIDIDGMRMEKNSYPTGVSDVGALTTAQP